MPENEEQIKDQLFEKEKERIVGKLTEFPRKLSDMEEILIQEKMKIGRQNKVEGEVDERKKQGRTKEEEWVSIDKRR